MAVVPDEIKEKVKAYGKGLLSPWSPQQTILEHPVRQLAAYRLLLLNCYTATGHGLVPRPRRPQRSDGGSMRRGTLVSPFPILRH